MPRFEDACGEAWNSEELDSTEFIHNFHPHQGDTGPDRGKSDRQGNATEGRPGADPQASTRLKLTTAADGEIFCAQQKHVGVGRQGHDSDAPTHAMNRPAVTTPQIDQRG